MELILELVNVGRKWLGYFCIGNLQVRLQGTKNEVVEFAKKFGKLKIMENPKR